MPTGYTCDIEKGISFSRFTLNCASAFIAMPQYDPPSGEFIPQEFKTCGYHEKQIKKYGRELDRVRTMTPNECYEASKSEWEQGEALLRKYNDMLQSVLSWSPPTENHVRLKEFMKQQIKDSIKWDCDADWYEKPKEKLTGSQWRAKKIELISSSLEYHKMELEKEIERCKANTAWVNDLRKSLEAFEKNA